MGFFHREGNPGGTDRIEHLVYTLKGVPPIKLKNRPVNPGLAQNLAEQVQTRLKDGVRKSDHLSPWNFPLHAVRKKNGKWRWVVDFRQLNAITRKDSWPIPNIQELLGYLKGSKYFSSIDLASAFHSIPIRTRVLQDTFKNVSRYRYDTFCQKVSRYKILLTIYTTL